MIDLATTTVMAGPRIPSGTGFVPAIHATGYRNELHAETCDAPKSSRVDARHKSLPRTGSGGGHDVFAAERAA
jgi:hypothetical protein